MTLGTNPDKNLAKKPRQRHNQHTDNAAMSELSSAKSELFSIEEMLGLNDLFGGKIVHIGFDCPENLRKALKQETHDNGSSYCKELQKYAVSYVVASRAKKYALGTTMSRFVDANFTIGEMNFTQYVQTKRRRKIKKTLEIDEETETTALVCGYRGCKNEAVAKGVFQGKREFFLCADHFALAKNNRDWSDLGVF
jgi:hypothetical protein